MSSGDGRTGGSKSSGGSPAFSRDTRVGEAPEFYEFGPFRLDPTERTLMRGNEIVPLTPKAFDTLHLLVRSSGPVLDPAWTVSEVGLEDLVLAYMRQAAAGGGRNHGHRNHLEVQR